MLRLYEHLPRLKSNTRKSGAAFMYILKSFYMNAAPNTAHVITFFIILLAGYFLCRLKKTVIQYSVWGKWGWGGGAAGQTHFPDFSSGAWSQNHCQNLRIVRFILQMTRAKFLIPILGLASKPLQKHIEIVSLATISAHL